jgi:hypothetical protein
MMAPSLACWTTTAVTASKAVISVALPAPAPRDFVGVFTAIMTISASPMQRATSAEKDRFGGCALCLSGLAGRPSRETRTISARPGS